jgi:NAD(P)-dependent dehydrogenase (short-subunit alcohol dehydrogenase family)
MKLSGRAALVTGASTGTGRSIAVCLARNGAQVILSARNHQGLNETQRLIEEAGGKARLLPADLSNLESINGLIKAVKRDYSHVDIIANVAGIWHGENELFADKDFSEFSQKVIVDTYTVGVIAPSLIVNGLLPIISEGGTILNISGTFESGAKGWLPYYVAKKAIEDFTVGLAEELKDKKIRAICISPSDTNTEEYQKYFPEYSNEALDPLEIAELAYKLCSDAGLDDSGKVYVVEKGQQPRVGYHT